MAVASFMVVKTRFAPLWKSVNSDPERSQAVIKAMRAAQQRKGPIR
jgi:hypothetical protein